MVFMHAFCHMRIENLLKGCDYKGARYTKKWSCQFTTNWGNHYYAEGHVLQKKPLYYRVRQVLQIGARAITKWGKLFITKCVNCYCKVELVLLSGVTLCKVGELLQSGTTIIEKASTSS